eukprot:CAMPEP_0117756736 /NCGR_PEP_ID=MMETSP0947-20121206/14276_1 /TAXON_ID=44440 /ORGANISM="Chattonella subsalsa, Strain CCMP2191" /LENGTH=520 /DNA_ID=CAMNT_0005576421 /DNA_START=133 /DNA_END=1695 /DNA_ORIENTATION=+
MGSQQSSADKDKLSVLSWNIAAVNNNPFEYWISHDDEAYNRMMEDVQAFIDNPGESDIQICQVFTPEMFAELKELMLAEGWDGIEETEQQYEVNYKTRTIISGFMKDKDIGKKRLASMPDRITNTINTVDQGIVCRPTVINMYEQRMDSLEEWWAQWKQFFFNTTVTIKGRGGAEEKKVCAMLQPIKSSKYPAITPEEESISIPLQTMCQAIFDSILVHMLNTVAPGVWYDLKMQLCNALNKRKNERTFEILEQEYGDTDICFLQEVAAAFVESAKSRYLGERYEILCPEKLDAKRDQNSVIMVKKGLFDQTTAEEITNQIADQFPSNCPVADGDLYAVKIRGMDGLDYVLASFHGDTNGLATIPVVNATHSIVWAMGHPRLIFGMDANTYEKGGVDKGLQDVTEFAQSFVGHGLTSCFGDTPNPSNYTTFNARTYLQPQLNKAVKKEDRALKGDINPKDFILFYKSQFTFENTGKDNTGKKGEYIEDMVFPTLQFPSDHGVLSTDLIWTNAPTEEEKST